MERMKKFILSLSGIENLEIFAPSIEIILKALDKMKEYKLDFDDALVVSCMISNKIKKLVSFDKHFDKIKEIERIEPNKI
jgi:predicted nucleic acid-binding protein